MASIDSKLATRNNLKRGALRVVGNRIDPIMLVGVTAFIDVHRLQYAVRSPLIWVINLVKDSR